jgi:hypothetical protein
MDDYIITDHAYFEMQRRGISKKIIQSILTNPDQIVEIRQGRSVYQSKVQFDASYSMYLIRVFIDIDREPPEVVTAYRTSKIEKYWI